MNGGNAVFNFNGGTLKAASASAAFMSGLSGAIVYSGGATSMTAATRSRSARR